MSTYHFIPHVRDGMAKLISGPPLGKEDLPPGALSRISLPMTVTLNGHAVLENGNTPQLYGPGDLAKLVTEEIIRTGPLHLTPDYAIEKFAFIEFHRPDFPWIFTPGAHAFREENGGLHESLRPWLVLVVVQKAMATITPAAGNPLPMLRCPLRELPPNLNESWAWAHAVYTGKNVEDISTLATNLRENPEQSLSRLVCARKLAPHTPYEACLVPAFEAGRKAGLGLPINPEKEPLKHWTFASDAEVQLPVYHHWSFSTGEEDPFIALTKKIQPWTEKPDQPPDMDLSRPWDGPPYDSATAPILSALRLKAANPTQENIPPHFKDDLTRLLTQPVEPSNPRISVPPPLYGSWHALVADPTRQLDEHAWLKTLNLGPSYRVAAALGTKIIQREQEQLVAAAWEQVAELRRVNDFLQRKQFASAITDSIHKKRLTALAPPVFSQMAEPLVFTESTSGAPRLAGFRSFRTTPNGRSLRSGKGQDSEERDGTGGLFSEQVLADAPIAYYRFNENPGSGLVLDSSGNNHHSVAVESGITLGVPGIGLGGDRAALFNGSSGRIIVPNREPLNPPRITLEAVIQWDGETTIDWQTIVGKQSYVDTATMIQYGLLLMRDGRVFVRLRKQVGGPAQHMDATSIGVVAPDVGTHVAATYDGSAIRIYLNGLLDSTTPTSGDPIDTKADQSQLEVSLTLGNLTTDQDHPVNKPFHGLIDEVAIYKTPLSAERIQAHARTVFSQTLLERAAATPQYRRTTRATGSWSIQGDINRYNPEHIAPPPGATEGAREVSGYRSSTSTSPLVKAIGTGIGTSRKDAWLGETEPQKTFTQEAKHRVNFLPPANLQNTVSEDSPADDRFQQPDPLGPYTYAPSFPQPMYGSLRDNFPDALLPNLNNIPNDRAAFLTAEDKFIEAYMVGLNHELSREFLWREFPTLLNTTYFQQFWDASGARNPQTPDLAPAPDLQPIGEWANNDLGKNLDPKRGSDLTFLLIRGELIVRYPNVMISARLDAPDSNANTRFPILRFSPIAGTLLLGFDIRDTTGWKFFAEEHFTEPYLGPNTKDPTEPNTYVSFLREQDGAPMYGGRNSAEVASSILKKRHFEAIMVH